MRPRYVHRAPPSTAAPALDKGALAGGKSAVRILQLDQEITK
jgi:hypothetical protein